MHIDAETYTPVDADLIPTGVLQPVGDGSGSMDADDVVLGFLVPPDAGKDGVPLQTLFGFERIHVKAGETVLVNLYPELTDFAYTLLDGTKKAVAGEWTVKFGVKETAQHGQGYAELKLTTY